MLKSAVDIDIGTQSLAKIKQYTNISQQLVSEKCQRMVNLKRYTNLVGHVEVSALRKYFSENKDSYSQLLVDDVVSFS